MDDERMEGAVHQGTQDDKQDDQSGDALAGIASRFPIFDGDIGVLCSSWELRRIVVRSLGVRCTLIHEQTGTD